MSDDIFFMNDEHFSMGGYVMVSYIRAKYWPRNDMTRLNVFAYATELAVSARSDQGLGTQSDTLNQVRYQYTVKIFRARCYNYQVDALLIWVCNKRGR